MKQDEELARDVREIKLDARKSKADRIKEYIRQTGNPCRVRIGEVLIDMEYSRGGKSMQELLEGATLSEKG